MHIGIVITWNYDKLGVKMIYFNGELEVYKSQPYHMKISTMILCSKIIYLWSRVISQHLYYC